MEIERDKATKQTINFLDKFIERDSTKLPN